MKNALIVSGVCAAALLQVSFLPPLLQGWWGMALVPLSLAMLALFASLSAGAAASVLGGFILDSYSSFPFGLWMIASLFVFLSVRYLLQNYVRLPQ